MKTTPKRRVRVVSAEVERNGRYLIVQRRPEATMPLLWEFPGGRVRQAESDTEALLRKLSRLLGVPAVVGPVALEVTHEYDAYTLDLTVYTVQLVGEPFAARVHDLQWVLPDEFDQYPFPGADQKSVDALLSEP